MPAPVFYDGKLPSSPDKTDIDNKINHKNNNNNVEKCKISFLDILNTEIKAKMSDTLMHFGG